MLNKVAAIVAERIELDPTFCNDCNYLSRNMIMFIARYVTLCSGACDLSFCNVVAKQLQVSRTIDAVAVKNNCSNATSFIGTSLKIGTG